MQKRNDFIVVGGGIEGCLSALRAARQGKKVVLIEKRGYLGREMTAKLRPWIKKEGINNLNDDLHSILFNPEEEKEVKVNIDKIPEIFNDEKQLFCGTIKKSLLNLLKENNVTVIFMSEIAGLVVKEHVQGIMLANKYGFQVIWGNVILDATENDQLMNLVNESVSTNKYNLAHFTIEYKDVDIPSKRKLEIPEQLGLYQDQINLHPGKLEPGHLYVEFTFEIESEIKNSFQKTKLEQKARNKAVLLAEYLQENHKAFNKSYISQMSYECSITESENDKSKGTNFADSKNFQNLFSILNQDITNNLSCQDLINKKEKTIQAVDNINSKFKNMEANKGDNLKQKKEFLIQSNDTQIPLSECELSKMNTYWMNIFIEKLKFQAKEFLKIKDECQVLIAGGGNGGASAGIAASKSLEDVIMVEHFSDLGGTQTLGIVPSYYFGYKGGFTSELDKKVNSLKNRINGTQDSPEVIPKMLTYQREFIKNGGQLYTNTVISDSIVKDEKVEGIVAVNSEGMFILEADIIVDATGDSDLAVFSGAEYEMGDPRDGTLQDYSQRGKGPGGTGDLDVINNDKLPELIRGIYITHQKSQYYDFAPFPTVRESRRIIGDYYLDLVDVLEDRHFEDTIAVAKTDSDQHGLNSSWLARMGYEPYHGEEKEVEIPYRACIVKGIEGIMLASKSISGSKDGVAFARMASDIQNRGYAIGRAAVRAAEKEGKVRNIDIEDLQTELKEMKNIPPEIFNRSIKRELTNEETIEKRIKNLKTGNNEALLPVLTLPKHPTLELLKNKYSKTTNRDEKIKLAKALAWFGSQEGTSLLFERLNELNNREGKLEYDDEHPEKPGNGKGGIIYEIDDYWRINQLLVVLGIAGDKQGIDIISKVVEKTNAGGKPEARANDYVKTRIDLQRIPHYDRILNICFCLERLADKKFIKPLEQILEKPYMSGYLSLDNQEAGRNYINANMEIRIARTLARCGETKGAIILANYLKDIHAILEDHVYEELKEITGKDFGRNSKKWLDWLKSGVELDVKPYRSDEYIF